MKLIFYALVLCISLVSAAKASDPLCGYQSLTVEFGDEGLDSRIHGVIDAPSSAYQYTLSFSEDVDGALKGTLSLAQPSDILGAAVITPLAIDEQVMIPDTVETIFIGVVKSFNWGPEYFKGVRPDGYQYTCLTGDAYK